MSPLTKIILTKKLGVFKVNHFQRCIEGQKIQWILFPCQRSEDTLQFLHSLQPEKCKCSSCRDCQIYKHFWILFGSPVYIHRSKTCAFFFISDFQTETIITTASSLIRYLETYKSAFCIVSTVPTRYHR